MYKDYLSVRERREGPKHWTEARVRADLPHVKLRVEDGTVLNGVLAGRLNPRATVWVYGYLNPEYKLREVRTVQFDWKDVIASLNDGEPLAVVTPKKKKKRA